MGKYTRLLTAVIILLLYQRARAEQDIESFSPPEEEPELGHVTQEQAVPPSPPVSVPEAKGDPLVTPDQDRANYFQGNYLPIMIPMPGPPGPPGYPGPTGATGPAGMPGNHGNNGNNGLPGILGPEGPKGNKGEQGYPGISGAHGVPGIEGQTGARGPPGIDGNMGLAGSPGKHGIVGSHGPRGETGPRGREGLRGGKGDTGAPGADGVCIRDTTSPVDRFGLRTSAFSVARTSGLTATDGPLTITFQHVFTNVGDDYNVNTGKFNCSIPGVYFFTVNVYKSSQQNFPLVQILLNGDHVAAVIDYGGADAEDSATNSVILSLRMGDMVWLQLYDGREIYSSHYRFTTFSGFRIG